MRSHPLPLLFIVIAGLSFRLLTMMSSMNILNTSRLIVILSVIILSMVLWRCFLSPLKINLQIFSLSHILRDIFVLWLTNLRSPPPTLSLRGAVTCNRLVGFRLVLHTYLCLPPILLHSYSPVYFYYLRNKIQLFSISNIWSILFHLPQCQNHFFHLV